MSGLFNQASLVLVPSGYKAGKVYSEVPTNGDGDLTFTRASSATRVNSDGEIEVVGSGVPRLDYSQGSCPALLLEPQRTNLVRYSEEFDVSPWAPTSTTVTANTTMSPDGSQTADTLTTVAIFNNIIQTVSVTQNTTYTFSFYALRGTMTDLKYSVFNLSSSSNIIAPTSYYSQTNSSTWSRIVLTFTTPTGCTSINIYPIRDTGSIGTVYIWGAQLEEGAYATSYIKTTSATVTRLADAFSRNNIYTNGLITSSGGTWFVELKNNVVYLRDAVSNGLFLSSTANGSGGDTFGFQNAGSGTRLSIFKRINGSYSGLFTTTTDTIKVAIKWNDSTADVFVNGVKEVSSTAFATTNMEFLNALTSDVPKYIQAMQLYPTPLSDSDCIQLTTL